MADRDRLGPIQRLHRQAGLVAIRLADVMRPRVNLGVRLIALDEARRVFLVRHSYLPAGTCRAARSIRTRRCAPPRFARRRRRAG